MHQARGLGMFLERTARRTLQRAMRDVLAVAEPLAGTVLYFLVIADLLLTVLYARLGARGVARLGAGFLSGVIGRSVRRTFIHLGRAVGHRDAVLSFTGPVTVILLPIAWTWLLTLAAALVIHPRLGISIAPASIPAATDFVTALYAAGTSLAITGSSEYIPRTSAMRFFFLSNSVVGTTVMTLTLTYLMQVYPALQQRNALALTIHAYTGRTGDAANLVAAFLPRGDLSPTSSNLAALGQTFVEVEENYHFYPVLFYFRPPNIEYADVRFITVALDAAALLRSALAPELEERLADAAPVMLLRDAAFQLAQTLEGTFVDEDVDERYRPDESTIGLWTRRFDAAWERLARARVPLAADRAAAARRYVEERAKWQPTLAVLGHKATYGRDEMDPALWPPGG